MPKSLPSKFQEYEFTPEEVKEAKVLSPLTKMYLQHEMSITMMRKVALVYDHENEQDWKLLHAELDGRISLLAELLQVEPVASTKSKEK